MRMTYRSGGARGSYPKTISKKLGSGHTFLFTSLRPAVLISVSKSTHCSTSCPATPAKANVGIHLPPRYYRKRHTLVLDWLRKVAPENSYLGLVSFKHRSSKLGAGRCTHAVTDWKRSTKWTERRNTLTNNYVTTRPYTS